LVQTELWDKSDRQSLHGGKFDQRPKVKVAWCPMPGTNGTANEGIVIPHRLLTLPEAAHYLGCTIWSVRELIWKGQLPYTRFGKRFQVDRQDLDELVDREKRCEGTGPATRRVTQGASGIANALHADVVQTRSLNEECEDETGGRKGKKQQAKPGV
jgi:excisionase family DNA binding protein